METSRSKRTNRSRPALWHGMEISTKKLLKEIKKMNATRNELIDRMVRLYGFENSITIEFCRACEEWAQTEENTRLLEVITIAHEQFPIKGED